MIYLLVNNDYHLYDFDSWKDDFVNQEISLIQVPHTLEVIHWDERFINTVSFKPFFNGIKSLLRYNKIRKLHNEIDQVISPNKKDILLVYTEYEVLNQYIVQKFKSVGARVWLLEDALATMVLFNGTFKSLNLKHSVLRWILKNVYGYKYLNMLYDGRNIFPVMSDNIFEGVCVSLGTSIKRNIKLFRYRKRSKLIFKLDNDRAIFLNEDVYNFYCGYDEYIDFLIKTLDLITRSFKIVYFKFHPRETKYNRDLISKEINRFPNVIFIEENQIVEEIIEKYNPKFAISFSSTASINLFFRGLEPIYIYHLFTKLRENLTLQGLTLYLESINYRYVSDLNEINASYSSGIMLSNKLPSLSEIILNRY